MSTEDKTDQSSYLTEQVSPGSISDRSSAASWNTPVSTTNAESIPSSVSWDTPKSFKSPGEHVELVRTTDGNENILVPSPVISTMMIPNDDPPPYSCDDEPGLWSPLRYIRDPFGDGSHYSSNRSRELAGLLEDPISATRTSPVSPSLGHTYRNKSPSRISFRSNCDACPGTVKERDTFAHKYGTICIVAIFIVFLMILSLTAKFLVNTTFSL